MKAKKKIIFVLFIIILVVFVRAVLSSYAKYTNIDNLGTGGSIKTWKIKINNMDIQNNKIINLEEAKVFSNDETSMYFPDGVLAPSNFGYFEIDIDYSDVTVPFIYDISAESDSDNRNIIDYMKIFNGETDNDVKAYMEDISKSSLSVNNPLVGNVDVDVLERTMKVRVYVIWKHDGDGTNNYIDTVTANEGINYKITLYFRQDIGTPTPQPVEYGLAIADRTNIIDNDADGNISFGDEVDLSGEKFYVLSTSNYQIDGKSNYEVKMLAKYNLNVNFFNANERFQDECSSIDCNLPFYVNPKDYKVGYWSYVNPDYYNVGDGNEKLLNSYVYSRQSNLYGYVENYKRILSDRGYSSLVVSVPSYKDILTACGGNIDSCNSPDWLFSTSYWTGSAFSIFNVWSVDTGLNRYSFANRDDKFGLRPIVIMNAKDIIVKDIT